MLLEQEINYFEEHLGELLEHHEGQFALVKRDRLVGTYSTFKEAYEAGVQEFGIEAFLVKQVSESEDLTQLAALTVGMLDADI